MYILSVSVYLAFITTINKKLLLSTLTSSPRPHQWYTAHLNSNTSEEILTHLDSNSYEQQSVVLSTFRLSILNNVKLFEHVACR